jgi:hypothetical protein
MNKWSKQAPTEPGLYWFYGDFRGNMGSDYKNPPDPLDARLLLITIWRIAGGELAGHANGQFLPLTPFDKTAKQKNQEGFVGFWMPANPPEVPPLNLNAATQEDV